LRLRPRMRLFCPFLMVCFSANPHHFAAARMPQLLTKVLITTNTRCPHHALAVQCRNPSLSITAQTTALLQSLRREPTRGLTNPCSGSHQRFCRAVEQPLHARIGQSTPMHALPMKPLGLNLAIPSAVRSGFAIQLSAWPAPPTSGSHAPGVQGDAAPSSRADSVAAKLVGSA
jgi:hypothetical protein